MHVEVSETAISWCDNDQEKFDDGMNHEHVKCTTAHQRNAVWSHHEYQCQRTYKVSLYRVVQKSEATTFEG